MPPPQSLTTLLRHLWHSPIHNLPHRTAVSIPIVLSRRCLATSTPTATLQKGRPTSFTDKLNKGPSFADFIGSAQEDKPLSYEESMELAGGGGGGGSVGLGEVGKKGYPVTELKRKKHVKLPEWLKTEIPVSAGYNAIKEDLKDLGLHTGLFLFLFPLLHRLLSVLLL